jgi:hypothetical protein
VDLAEGDSVVKELDGEAGAVELGDLPGKDIIRSGDPNYQKVNDLPSGDPKLDAYLGHRGSTLRHIDLT